MALMLAAGFAALPHGLPRHGTTPAVYDARKAHGWAVVISAIILLTLAAGVALWRGMLLEQVVGQPVARLPQWVGVLRDLGIVTIRTTAAPTIDIGQIAVVRDQVFLGLAISAGLPRALVLLMGLGAVAAALIAITAALHTLSTTISEDIVFGLARQSPSPSLRVSTARAAAGASGVIAFAVAALRADPLHLVLAAVTLSASAIFPVLVLSILWRRMTSWGALLGLLTGFGIAALGLLVSEIGLLALAAPLPAVVAMPAAVVMIVVGSYATRHGSRGNLELLRDMRVPGGETIRDRTARVQRAKELLR
jgi:cation/acetate symporter